MTLFLKSLSLLSILTIPLMANPSSAAVPQTDRLATMTYPQPEKVRKLLLIGIDGLRPDALLSVRAPNLRALIRGGAFAPDAVADSITRSGPGWASVLTGVWHGKHGVLDNEIGVYQGDLYPAFFKRMKESRPDLYLACIVNWAPIRDRLMPGLDLALAPENDDSVAAMGRRLLLRGNPDALFLHFDSPDYAGHKYGFSRFSPPYRRAIERADAQVGKILEALRARPGYFGEDWLILVTTDHGGSWRHHGEDIPAHRKVFLIVSGDQAVRGTVKGASLVDLAPTAMAFMGMEVDPRWGWEGKAVGLKQIAPIAAQPRPEVPVKPGDLGIESAERSPARQAPAGG